MQTIKDYLTDIGYSFCKQGELGVFEYGQEMIVVESDGRWDYSSCGYGSGSGKGLGQLKQFMGE